MSEAELRHLLEPYGPIQSLRLIGRRGMAFAELDAADANAAVEGLRGTQLKGRTVDIALERSGGGRGRPPSRRGRRR